jgi:diacylglycerol kinase (ATP)
VRHALRDRYDLVCWSPSSAAETEAAARQAADEGARLVVVAGGDGTLNAAANGLMGSAAALGIVPLGTANDLAREVGVADGIDGAIRHLAAGITSPMDVVLVNGRGFCTVGGLGLVTRSTDAASRLKGATGLARSAAALAGSSIYRIVTTLALLSPDPLLTSVQIDYVDSSTAELISLSAEVHAVFVTNHRTLGGGLRLPVEASGSDGAFEIVLVRRRPRASLILNFARLSAGLPVPPGVIEVLRARSARIRTGGTEAFVADGERLAESSSFEVEIRPGSLRVITGRE